MHFVIHATILNQSMLPSVQFDVCHYCFCACLVHRMDSWLYFKILTGTNGPTCRPNQEMSLEGMTKPEVHNSLEY